MTNAFYNQRIIITRAHPKTKFTVDARTHGVEVRFVTIEAADRSLLRENQEGEEHEEDADDKADVEVDDRRPTLRVLTAPLLAGAHRLFLPAAASWCCANRRSCSKDRRHQGSIRIES